MSSAPGLLEAIVSKLPENVWVQVLRKNADDYDIASARGTSIEKMRALFVEAGLAREKIFRSASGGSAVKLEIVSKKIEGVCSACKVKKYERTKIGFYLGRGNDLPSKPSLQTRQHRKFAARSP